MAAAVARPMSTHQSMAPGNTPIMQHLTIDISPSETPNPSSKHTAVPNKHIPYCPPGPSPGVRTALQDPITATSSKSADIEPTSILYPPDSFQKINDSPTVYSINAATLAEALDHIASQPLADPQRVFPWLHGLHAQNQFQLNFFSIRNKTVHKVPKCLRAITVVKAGGELSHSKIKGAIAPEELILGMQPALSPIDPQITGDDERIDEACFIEANPKTGFSCRNFHIQACKMATVSDIIVYGDHETPRDQVVALATRLSRAQDIWLSHPDMAGVNAIKYNTFIVEDDFHDINRHHPHIVAINMSGEHNDNVVDLATLERQEMAKLSEVSEISRNIWLGPTIDPNFGAAYRKTKYDCCIEAGDNFQSYTIAELDQIEKLIGTLDDHGIVDMQAPGSGTLNHESGLETLEKFHNFVRWVYKLANPPNRGRPARRFLIHCADGYTETTLFALAYIMYAEGLSAPEAYIRLHRDIGRNFFAYPGDKILLRHFEYALTDRSPAGPGLAQPELHKSWFQKMDGSLPSRVLPYLYLGNLAHANNPELLRRLGIKRVLSIGEAITWPSSSKRPEPGYWGKENFLFVDNVQDNGVDPLTCEFGRCLEFIELGKRDGTATLVHCRVGVSRSATICIAEVMNELGLSFPRAYCFVRARRLNVIIQPHLRFAYELLKWEEYQAERRGVPLKREMEWAHLAREIAGMNRPYCGVPR